MYKAVECDDGSWMVCTEGDVICVIGQGNEEAKAQMVAAALNQYIEREAGYVDA